MRIPEKDVKPEDTPHAFAPPHGPAWPLAGSCEVCTRGSGHHIHDAPEVDPGTPHEFVWVPHSSGFGTQCGVCGGSKGNELHDAPEVDPEIPHVFIERIEGTVKDGGCWVCGGSKGHHIHDAPEVDPEDTPHAFVPAKDQATGARCCKVCGWSEGRHIHPATEPAPEAPKVPWVLEGFEPRAWFSPTDGYFLYSASNAGEMRMIRAWDSRVVTTLPEDAHEIGGYPTQHAYDVVCSALAQHRERADNLEGRHKALRDKILPVIGGDWTIGPPPLEVAVDTLIHLVRMAEFRGEES